LSQPGNITNWSHPFLIQWWTPEGTALLPLRWLSNASIITITLTDRQTSV